MPNAESVAPEMFDSDGYPNDEWLDYMRTFTGTPHQLVDLLSEAMSAYGGVRVEPKFDAFGKPIHEVYMATGGWSGNESIISELKHSFFWFAYWEMSQRGGAYTFHVRDQVWDEPMPDWPFAHKTRDTTPGDPS